MGDRCYVSVRCKRADQKLFVEEGFTLDDLDCMVDEECNCGGYDILEALAQQGVVFVGDSGSGSGYGPALFVGVGGRFYYVECCEGLPIVRFDVDGPIQAEVEQAQHYFAALAEAEAILKEDDKLQEAEEELERASFGPPSPTLV